MASKTPCTACLRLLRQHTQKLPYRPPPLLTHRFLSTSPFRLSTQSSPTPSSPSPAPLSTPSTPSTTPPTSPPKPSTTTKIAQELRRLAGNTTETYVAYGVTENLYKECARVGHYTVPQAGVKGEKVPKTASGEDLGVGEGWWYDELHLPPTFSTWSQLTILHIHLLTTHLRRLPPAHFPTYHRHLLDHFFHDAENRMLVNHHITAGSIRSRYLKDLFVQYRGAVAAYDEGFARGSDAVLAAALWRNLWAARPDVDWWGLAVVVSYVRRVVKGLEGVGLEDLGAGMRFGEPGVEGKVVDRRSKLWDEGFGEQP
ncbi:hypothetical protein FGG08_005260 [Glutinoglossum americanum]|uniref:Ubiquinol-cytochrome c chaperone domain-containing protein n=1 Tax=Glutinoglossum americanum TaxID=1670608 RepID=A0A9P8I3N5_9PEZI|nr:hypothetical protein FGG08_005260 [Glutinoglossum americanum]